MSIAAKAQLHVILYEGKGAKTIPERGALMRRLLEDGFKVSLARSEGALTPIADTTLLVLGRFEDGAPRDQDAVVFRSIEGQDSEAIAALVAEQRAGQALPEPGGWKPWFPVIDFDRCTDCMQCLSFCLFDVYGVDDRGSITVQNQDNCKTDCPACSRVCPEVAILFPKYREGPINGADISAEDLKREAMKVDISALLGGDIYAALRNRSAKAKSRFSKERDEDRALRERKKCLNKLKDSMDIPAEVLMALPSLSEIEDKARQAKERAERALESRDARREEQS